MDTIELPAQQRAALPQPRDEAFAQAVDAACGQACRRIAPAWPLDRSIAVNPHWGRIALPLTQVAARLAVLGGLQVYPARSYVQGAWSSGRIAPADLQAAVQKLASQEPGGPSAQQCVAALGQPVGIQPLPLLIDLLDSGARAARHFSWKPAVTHQISQTCASYFDQHQADWRPQAHGGLYAFWRETISHDSGIGVLMGLPRFSACVEHLPHTPAQAEQWALRKFGLEPALWSDYLEALLLTVNGWASWCAYLGWQATLQGHSSPALRELLAIRLAWGAILLESCSAAQADTAFHQLRQAWRAAPERMAQAQQLLQVDAAWQTALEYGYQRALACKLSSAVPQEKLASPAAPQVQAVFCIDVRSERLRRALETVNPTIQTLGFAGFFGLPMAYQALGSTTARPQLPGLLAPSLTASDELVTADGALAGSALQALGAQRRRSFLHSQQWQALARWPGSSFSLVETVGLAFAGQLGRWLKPAASQRAQDDYVGLPMRLRPLCRPTLLGLGLEQKVALLAPILAAMGLRSGFAPLVLLVGHGSQSSNNPHAAGLDCGACGGQTGEMNVRVLARLLNDAEVRAGLAGQGIVIGAPVRFVAALHNTSTDALECFDTDLLDDSARARLQALQPSFSAAQEQVRRERAPALGLDPLQAPADLLRALQQRASDGAQTRPEWGLAGNAAFIIGPRRLTQPHALDGRSFLHDYDADSDADGRILEQLMTAPMLVTHWINWQYHASVCEPHYYGSGNKVLHNVVGGHIGVFEGNGGDLRTGLSRQSVHDGLGYVHEPLRLTVVVCAPQPRIAAIVQKHPVLQQLLGNGWLHLWQLQEQRIAVWDPSGWLDFPSGPA